MLFFDSALMFREYSVGGGGGGGGSGGGKHTIGLFKQSVTNFKLV